MYFFIKYNKKVVQTFEVYKEYLQIVIAFIFYKRFNIVFASLFPYFPVSSEYIGSDDPPSAHSNSWCCVPSLKEQEQN